MTNIDFLQIFDDKQSSEVITMILVICVSSKTMSYLGTAYQTERKIRSLLSFAPTRQSGGSDVCQPKNKKSILNCDVVEREYAR